jgi:hypothetical protein
LIIPPTEGQALYYQEINVDYVHESPLSQNSQYYTITLEYGEFPKDASLCLERDPDPDDAHQDVYVHPIIRCYSGAKLLREHHIPEVLENDWTVFQFLRRVDEQDGNNLRHMYKERVAQFFKDEIELNIKK